MSNDYFEERFIEETFQENVAGENTSRLFYFDELLMMNQMRKDHKWVLENLKKLELHKTLKKYGKVPLINSSTDDLRTAERVLNI